MNRKSLIFCLTAGLISSTLLFTACTKQKTDSSAKNTTTVNQTNKIKFLKEIKLDEVVNVDFQMTVAGKSQLAQASFKIKEIGELDKMGNTTPIAGQTFYYVIYDFMGNANNPTGTDAQPQMFLDLAAPQIVMLEENTLPSIGGAVGGAYNSDFQQEKGLDGYEMKKMNQASWVSTASTWYTTKREKPIMAIQYVDETGNKQYIKINY